MSQISQGLYDLLVGDFSSIINRMEAVSANFGSVLTPTQKQAILDVHNRAALGRSRLTGATVIPQRFRRGDDDWIPIISLRLHDLLASDLTAIRNRSAAVITNYDSRLNLWQRHAITDVGNRAAISLDRLSSLRCHIVNDVVAPPPVVVPGPGGAVIARPATAGVSDRAGDSIISTSAHRIASAQIAGAVVSAKQPTVTGTTLNRSSTVPAPVVAGAHDPVVSVSQPGGSGPIGIPNFSGALKFSETFDGTSQFNPDHIVILMMESRTDSDLFGSGAPAYFQSLAASGVRYTNDTGGWHFSEDNYFNVGSGRSAPNTTAAEWNTLTGDGSITGLGYDNIFRQIIAAGKTVKVYCEDYPGSNPQTNSGNYAFRHNPCVFYSNPSPSTLTRPFAGGSDPFPTTPTGYAALPKVSFVCPNLVNDGHTSPGNTPSAMAAWVQTHMDGYIQWCKTNNSVFMYWTDEGDAGNAIGPDTQGATNVSPIGTLIIGQGITPSIQGAAYRHINWLATLEDMLGLPRLVEAIGVPAMAGLPAGGSGLDTSKWSTGWLASGVTKPVNPAEIACYVPSQVSVGGGNLKLSLIAYPQGIVAPQNGVTYYYITGCINSYGKFTFGPTPSNPVVIEFRAYCPGANANHSLYNWPAVWCNATPNGEMDVMEGLSGYASGHWHSPAGGPGFDAPGNYSGWHTFATHWSTTQIDWYYDGVLVGSISSGILSTPQYIVIGNQLSNSAPQLIPSDMLVDYVKVWQ